MPEEVRDVCRLADITSKSTLLQIVRQADPQKMLALVKRIAAQGTAATRETVRRETAKTRTKPGRSRPYVFAFRAPSKTFKLRMSFSKSKVEKSEIIGALESILKELKSAK